MDAASRARWGRQIRLPEVGEQGQERLLGSTLVLGSTGFAREVERRYLALAGAQPVEVAPEGACAMAVDVDPATLGLRHGASREIGEGALRALAALRAVLLR